MNYPEEKARLNDLIQGFLDGHGIGSYSDEAHMRSALAAKLRKEGFDAEEEKEVNMGDDEILRPDIVVHIGNDVIPIELKYDNSSIDEYKEDEKKCERYVEDFGNVQDAYCVFVSSIEHRDYRYTDWVECAGNSKYQYLLLEYNKNDGLYF